MVENNKIKKLKILIFLIFYTFFALSVFRNANKNFNKDVCEINELQESIADRFWRFMNIPSIYVGAQSIEASTSSDYCKLVDKPSDCVCGKDDGLIQAIQRKCGNKVASQGLAASIEAFTMPETIRTYPQDLSKEDKVYAFSAIEDVEGLYDSCAKVEYIERVNQNNYEIKLKMKLSGRGCKINIPWKVSPHNIGVKVYGEDALERCEKGAQCDIMKTAVKKGEGLYINFDPPIYRFPLTQDKSNHKERSVPFGYAGYYTYDKTTKGSCGKYGFDYFKRTSRGIRRKAGSLGIALSFPDENTCSGQVPGEGAFVSNFTARVVADRVATLYRAPLSLNNRYMRTGNATNIFFNSQVFNGAASSQIRPYSYMNVVNLLGIQNPFYCGENNRTRGIIPSNDTAPIYAPDNFKYSIGGNVQDVHSCPMSVAEWDSILPDLVLEGVNVDHIFGPFNESVATLHYDQIEQAGHWHIPKEALGNMPLGIYRCSHPGSTEYASNSVSANFASPHYPIVMPFGPNCAALSPLDVEDLLRVAVGGFAGVRSLDDEEEWITSAGIPVRIAKNLGITNRKSDGIDAPGVNIYPSSSSIDLDVIAGTSADSLNFDPNIIKYILCNGGGGFPMRSGMNTTSGKIYGPLTSNLTAEDGEGPIWPNVLRFSSPANMSGECTGCNFQTHASQKGWTIMSSQMWANGQGEECGKYNMDHSLWGRILALVNTTHGFSRSSEPGPGKPKQYVDTEKYKIFSLWNSSSTLVNSFGEIAKALSQEKGDDIFLPKILSRSGIDGIGIEQWMSKASDALQHGCRPVPYFSSNIENNGASAIPMCSLLKQQLYQQMYAILTASDIYTASGNGFNNPLPDLDSAQTAGVYNRVSPNVYFGQEVLPENQGGTRWLAFFDDSWDRPVTKKLGTIGKPFGESGMAEDVEITMTITLPRSQLVSTNSEKITLYTLESNNEECSSALISPYHYKYISDVTNTQLYQNYGSISSFLSNYIGVTSLELKFVAQNCEGDSLNYDSNSYSLRTIPPSSQSSTLISVIKEFDDATEQNNLVVKMKYDTSSVNVTYYFDFNFTCPFKIDSSLPIGFDIEYRYNQIIQGSSSSEKTTIMAEKSGPKYCEKVFPSVVDNDQYYRIYMMNNIKPPNNLPIESVCAPFFDFSSGGPLQYNVTDLKSIEADTNQDPNLQYPSSGGEYIAYVSVESNALVTWVCETYTDIKNYGVFKQCNVSGAEGNKRTGDCVDISYFQGKCDEWWDLSCQPYNNKQLTFLFSLAIGIGFIVGFCFMLYVYFSRKRNLEEIQNSDEKKDK